MGRSTCASASALNFDAQPAQEAKLVRRICLPEGLALSTIKTPFLSVKFQFLLFFYGLPHRSHVKLSISSALHLTDALHCGFC